GRGGGAGGGGGGGRGGGGRGGTGPAGVVAKGVRLGLLVGVGVRRGDRDRPVGGRAVSVHSRFDDGTLVDQRLQGLPEVPLLEDRPLPRVVVVEHEVVVRDREPAVQGVVVFERVMPDRLTLRDDRGILQRQETDLDGVV